MVVHTASNLGNSAADRATTEFAAQLCVQRARRWNSQQEQTMDYQDFTTAVRELNFIPDDNTADAAVKGVLGMLASRMNESEARTFCQELPEPLTYDRLRGEQPGSLSIPLDEAVVSLSQQLDLDVREATRLVERVFAKLKAALPRDDFGDLAEALPADWGAMLHAA